MFNEQMRYLYVQRIPVISMAQLVNYLRDGTPVPDHSVVITLDDGYKTAYTKAWPILRRFHFPMTVFIYPQAISRHGNAMTWEDLREMASAGVDVESHSLTHPLLTHPTKAMMQGNYVAWLDHELAEPKHILESEIKKPVTVLAYPFGGYDERVVERTRKAGYLAALTCDDGNVNRMTDPFHINRRLVYHHVRLKEFSEYFQQRELLVTDLYPRDGQRIHGSLDEIRVRVLNMGQIKPDSVKILIDKVSPRAIPVTVNPKTGIFRLTLPHTQKHGFYFISVFARDRQTPTLRREASWIFIHSQPHTTIASKN